MRVYPEDLAKKEQNALDSMLQTTRSSYRTFSDYVAFRDDDPVWMLFYKLVLRFLGLIFTIVISPFVVIGLIIAFAAVF
ncbi:MAG TPA: hypothetical protein PKA00_04295 [Saprospiraceae bacterium]|nr:hypothetical protein [Saprospiraceae bacterium]HMQ82099.1 hypothetical protein [Saprospiraceae bacterium]